MSVLQDIRPDSRFLSLIRTCQHLRTGNVPLQVSLDLSSLRRTLAPSVLLAEQLQPSSPEQSRDFGTQILMQLQSLDVFTHSSSDCGNLPSEPCLRLTHDFQILVPHLNADYSATLIRSNADQKAISLACCNSWLRIPTCVASGSPRFVSCCAAGKATSSFSAPSVSTSSTMAVTTGAVDGLDPKRLCTGRQRLGRSFVEYGQGPEVSPPKPQDSSLSLSNQHCKC